MSFSELHIKHFRNIVAADISPSSGINFFVGENGSGKTSVLEAIYFLSRGRSFRSSQVTQLIQRDRESFLVRATVQRGQAARNQVGVEKQRGVQGIRLRMDGKDLDSREPIASLLPLVLINGDSYRLVEGGPKYRRQFIDWGMFHVEHSGREAWRHYRRVLRQRNAALRGPNSVLQLWSEQLASHSAVLDEERRRFITRISPYLSEYSQLMLGRDASLDYRTPWESAEQLAQVLHHGVDADRRAGFTKAGSHRANVMVLVDGENSREQLSRGQEKLMVYALMMALVRLLRDEGDITSALLADDMAAELDENNQTKVIRTLAELGAQLFITGTHMPDAVKRLTTKPGVFHVKHGTVVEE